MDDITPLAAFRKANSLSQDEMARRVGLASKGYYSRVERGREVPSVRVALAIEDETGGVVTACDLHPDVALVREHDRTDEAA